MYSYPFEGQEGFSEMNRIMDQIRNFNHLGDDVISQKIDYHLGIDGLPKSNVVKLVLDTGSTIIVRPSGTEPKIKIYLSIQEKDKETAFLTEKRLVQELNQVMKGKQ